MHAMYHGLACASCPTKTQLKAPSWNQAPAMYVSNVVTQPRHNTTSHNTWLVRNVYAMLLAISPILPHTPSLKENNATTEVAVAPKLQQKLFSSL